jgi:hypothetical protein
MWLLWLMLMGLFPFAHNAAEVGASSVIASSVWPLRQLHGILSPKGVLSCGLSTTTDKW